MKPAWLSIATRGSVLALLVAMLAASWLGPLESAANAQVDAGLKRALLSFASARALNGAISLAQGTEIAVQPAGVGVNLTVGQVLDPLNDLVEHFSDLMLMASVAFGVQKVLLEIGAHWLVSLLFTAAALGWSVCLLRRQPAPAWLSRLLLVLILTRFAMPLATIGSDALFQRFLADDYQASQQLVDRTAGSTERFAPAAEASEQGLVDRIKAWFGAQGAEWKLRFERLQQSVEQAIAHIVRLMVIFLLQTLVLPLLLLWGGYALVRFLLLPAR